MRTGDPRRALDYPHLPDESWVIWSGNDVKWPHGSRETFYVSADKRHVINDSALMTMFAEFAKTFDDEASARAWLAEQEALRGHPYHGVRVTTVATLKKARGYVR